MGARTTPVHAPVMCSTRVLVPRVAMVLAMAGLVYAPSPVVSQPIIAPAPDWVIVHDIPEVDERELSSRSGSSYVLLMDVQHDLVSKSVYLHFAVKILSHEGVQQLSEVSMDHDPSFQTLTLHRLQLRRGDRIIDKLGADPVHTLQRETNLESYIYDGTLTSQIHVSDVRIGDIIEYSYSRRGQNPAYGDHDFGHLLIDSFVSAELYLLRILVPDGRKVNFRYSGTDLKPEVLQGARYTEYRWKQEKLEEKTLDNNIPNWYTPFALVEYTDFNSWREMVEWALPLYEVAQPERQRLRELAGDVLSLEPESILKAIRFVQDEIRYLSLSEGMSAYMPHPPTQVWEQRYGDCKDKALLLSTLLTEMGVEAHPMLVSTAAPQEAEEFTIAPVEFNHCVVALRYRDRLYFVDPTISHQGGELENLFFPSYNFGLIVSADSDDLIPLPVSTCGSIIVTERVILDDDNGGTLFVKTRYSGERADMMRQYFAMSDLGSIQTLYLSYKARLYPDIRVNRPMSFDDDSRDTDNVITVYEYYGVQNIWGQKGDDEESGQLELFPLDLSASLQWNSSPKRTMPYAVGRVLYSHEFVVETSRQWNVAPEEFAISGDGFEYRQQVSRNGHRLTVVHRYQRTKSYIDAPAVAEFVAKHDQIRAQLACFLPRGGVGVESGNRGWMILLVILVGFAGALWGAFKSQPSYRVKTVETSLHVHDQNDDRADELEQLAAARLRAGVPGPEVVAWVVDHGVSPGMAAMLVKDLATRCSRPMTVGWFAVALRKYAVFEGRARRGEYWFFNLVYAIIGVSAAVMDHVLGFAFEATALGPIWPIYYMVCLVLFMPSLAVTVRRLHDVGRSGWFYLISFVPVLGGIWLLVQMCRDGTPGENKYGPDPKLEVVSTGRGADPVPA
jgi:uncharacterized membrane protein YhaH (DUF805 family)/transglutaminase-like putative cysteine protease